MCFFVKCPKQRPVQGRFKKVPFDKLMVLSKVEGQMYGAIEDKGMVPFGLEQFGLETCRRAHVESLTAERLRAERLCTILKRPTPVNVEGITKKDIHMLLTECSDFYPPEAD
jgi:hypothetical protein